MRHIPQNEIPLLPAQTIFNEECIAYGVGDYGVAIHFMERDKCILIEWDDVILYGIAILKEADTSPVKDAEEIPAPTPEG